RAAGTDAQGGRRAVVAIGWSSADDLSQCEKCLGSEAGREVAPWRWRLVGGREETCVSHNSQENDWTQSAGFNLRFSAAEFGDTTLLLDAWNCSVTGLRANRDNGDLHHG